MSDDSNKRADAATGGRETPDDLLVAGKVGKAKGVKGWTRCRSFTDIPTDLAEVYVTWRLRDPRGGITTWRVEDWRPTNEGDVLEVKLEGCDDRDLAMTLTNREIMVSRSEFPDTDEEGSYYWIDLVGFTVRDVDTGEPMGVMTGVIEQPSADLVEVEPFAAPADSSGSSDSSAASDSRESPGTSGSSGSSGSGDYSDSKPDTQSDSKPDSNQARAARSVDAEGGSPSGAAGGGSNRGKARTRGKGRTKKAAPKKILIPWVWGVFVLAVDMEARIMDVRWREPE